MIYYVYLLYYQYFVQTIYSREKLKLNKKSRKIIRLRQNLSIIKIRNCLILTFLELQMFDLFLLINVSKKNKITITQFQHIQSIGSTIHLSLAIWNMYYLYTFLNDFFKYTCLYFFHDIIKIKYIQTRMSNQLQALLSGAYFAALGFQPVQSTNIPSLLKKINPNNGTAMRDSLIEGSKLILKLHKLLDQMGTAQTYNFVHVILTDGLDENSESSLEDAMKIMIVIGKAIAVKTLKIIFIGVGVQAKAQKQLKLLATAGGQNAEYYNANSSQIGQIFNKIEINLGIQQRVNMVNIKSNQMNALMLQKQNVPYFQLKMKNFAVMFNLDVSGSMSGNKWNSVCSSVNGFISKLGGSDLVSSLVFNNKVKLLSTINQNDPIFSKPKPNQNIPNKTIMINNVKINEEDCQIM